MNEDEYKQAGVMIKRIAEHERKLSACAQDADDPFTSTMRGLLDLLGTAKKRLSDKIDGEPPPANE